MIKDKCHIKKDDKVKVISGKYKGKIGRVVRVISKTKRIVIENINIVKRHTKADMKSKGGIVEKEAPIHWSNVMLMCDKCMQPIRIKLKTLEDGKKVRVCGKCSEILSN